MTDAERALKREEIIRKMHELRQDTSFPDDIHLGYARVLERLDLLLDIMYLDYPELVDWRIDETKKKADTAMRDNSTVV